MENCKRCIFYDKEYDELKQSWDDKVIIGQEQQTKHYCRMYDDPINPDIYTGKTPCEYLLKD